MPRIVEHISLAIGVIGVTVILWGVLDYPAFCVSDTQFPQTVSPNLFSQVEGSAQPSVNASKVLGTALPLPEQCRIVADLDALQLKVDALKRLQAETAAELDALLPAILDRAFKGEL